MASTDSEDPGKVDGMLLEQVVSMDRNGWMASIRMAGRQRRNMQARDGWLKSMAEPGIRAAIATYSTVRM